MEPAKPRATGLPDSIRQKWYSYGPSHPQWLRARAFFEHPNNVHEVTGKKASEVLWIHQHLLWQNDPEVVALGFKHSTPEPNPGQMEHDEAERLQLLSSRFQTSEAQKQDNELAIELNREKMERDERKLVDLVARERELKAKDAEEHKPNSKTAEEPKFKAKKAEERQLKREEVEEQNLKPKNAEEGKPKASAAEDPKLHEKKAEVPQAKEIDKAAENLDASTAVDDVFSSNNAASELPREISNVGAPTNIAIATSEWGLERANGPADAHSSSSRFEYLNARLEKMNQARKAKREASGNAKVTKRPLHGTIAGQSQKRLNTLQGVWEYPALGFASSLADCMSWNRRQPLSLIGLASKSSNAYIDIDLHLRQEYWNVFDYIHVKYAELFIGEKGRNILFREKQFPGARIRVAMECDAGDTNTHMDVMRRITGELVNCEKERELMRRLFEDFFVRSCNGPLLVKASMWVKHELPPSFTGGFSN